MKSSWKNCQNSFHAKRGKNDLNSTNHFANNKQTDCPQNECVMNGINFGGKPNRKWTSQDGVVLKKISANKIHEWLNISLNDLSTAAIEILVGAETAVKQKNN